MELLLALKDSIDSDARMDAQAEEGRGSITWCVARKDFYNRWVKEDVHRALFASFEDEAQQLLEKYLDEVEASLDQREVKDPITGETRPADERFLRAVEEKIKVSDSGKQSFRQEVVRKAMVAYKAGEKFTLASHCAHARGDRAVPVRRAPRRAAAGDLERAPGRRGAQQDLGRAAAADRGVRLRRAQRAARRSTT